MTRTESESFLSEHCLDLRDLMSKVDRMPLQDRLSGLLKGAGCTFLDEACRLVSMPAVRLCAVGGLPVSALAAAGIGPCEISLMTRESMGACAAMSYLTLPGDNPLDAYRTVVEDKGHASVAHVVCVSLLVAGVTVGVENEFNAQRDLVHLSRVTVARTAVQSRPPLMAPDPELAADYAELLAACDRIRIGAEQRLGGVRPSRDRLESLNLMFPAAKATALLLTGSLRNLRKLLSSEDDEGKESEFRRALSLVRHPLGVLWPSLFERSMSTDAKPPSADS